MLKQLMVILISVSSLFAYSYTAFPPITGKETFAVNPAFFADKKNSGGMELFLYYGLTDKLDICPSILVTNGYSNFSGMLRYDFGNSKILSVKGNASSVIPQFTISLENDLLYLQGSVASQITYDYADKPAFYGIVCPGIKLFKLFDLFCEVNPGYYNQDGDFANCALRTEGFGLDVVPGIGFGIGKVLFSIAIPIYNVNNDATPTFGMWLYYSIK